MKELSIFKGSTIHAVDYIMGDPEVPIEYGSTFQSSLVKSNVVSGYVTSLMGYPLAEIHGKGLAINGYHDYTYPVSNLTGWGSDITSILYPSTDAMSCLTDFLRNTGMYSWKRVVVKKSYSFLFSTHSLLAAVVANLRYSGYLTKGDYSKIKAAFLKAAKDRERIKPVFDTILRWISILFKSITLSKPFRVIARLVPPKLYHFYPKNDEAELNIQFLCFS